MTRTRTLLAGLACLVAFAILIGLGTWQMQRLHWKEGLIAEIQARTNAAAVSVPPSSEWPGLDLAAWEYRPVTLTGRFRNGEEAYVFTVLSETHGPYGGPGYWVLTPFELSDGGGTVIVNRGFVPEASRDPSTRKAGQIEGEVTIKGLLRAPEPRNLFTPDDEPAKHVFYVRDAAPVAAAYGIAGAAPFTVDAVDSPEGGLPEGGESRISFPNNHFGYAMTWYGLAGGLSLVMLGALLRRFRPA